MRTFVNNKTFQSFSFGQTCKCGTKEACANDKQIILFCCHMISLISCLNCFSVWQNINCCLCSCKLTKSWVCKVLSVRALCMASAIAWTSPTGVNKPAFPLFRISLGPVGQSVATIILSSIKPSIKMVGKPSNFALCTSNWQLAIQG